HKLWINRKTVSLKHFYIFAIAVIHKEYKKAQLYDNHVCMRKKCYNITILILTKYNQRSNSDCV
ncbi:MAG: hypothetical protein NUK65_00360, partial [Firmicutes bacterium]|nr:hypothetical protein [Bacillota bacterium]